MSSPMKQNAVSTILMAHILRAMPIPHKKLVPTEITATVLAGAVEHGKTGAKMALGERAGMPKLKMISMTLLINGSIMRAKARVKIKIHHILFIRKKISRKQKAKAFSMFCKNSLFF